LSSGNPLKLSFIATVLLLLSLLPLLGTAVHWVAFRLARVRVKAVHFFQGNPLGTFTLFGDTVKIGYIPTGGSLEFDTPQMRQQSLFVRLAIVLASPAVMLLVGATFLGFASASQHFASGFSQLISGALHPRTAAFTLIARLQIEFTASLFTTVGIIACKLAAFSFLPLGGMTTAQSILQLFNPSDDDRAAMFYLTLNALSSIALTVCWAAAMVLYISTMKT
jgi:hypothetical protein